jgi:hypothetical protein
MEHPSLGFPVPRFDRQRQTRSSPATNIRRRAKTPAADAACRSGKYCALLGEFLRAVPLHFADNLFTLDGQKAQDQLTLSELSEIPEPGTLLLVGSGAAALAKRRRRKEHV